MKSIIGEWRALLLGEKNSGSEFQGRMNNMNMKFHTTFFHMRPALVLNGSTPHQLRLIKLISEKHFKDLAYVHMTSEPSSPQPLIVYTDSRDLLMVVQPSIVASIMFSAFYIFQEREVKSCQEKEAEMKIKDQLGFDMSLICFSRRES